MPSGDGFFHLKRKTAPRTRFEWAFFLAKTVADFDRLAEQVGSKFFFLFYLDRWRTVYRKSPEQEILSEWKRRGFTRKQRKFVMTLYSQRGIRLQHDVEREERATLHKTWQGSTWPG